MREWSDKCRDRSHKAEEVIFLIRISIQMLFNKTTQYNNYTNFIKKKLKYRTRQGRKEMFYLTMHLTHFILRLYGVRHMGPLR